MKKIFLSILVLLLLFMSTSCLAIIDEMFFVDDNEIAEETFAEIIDAIKEEDDSKIVKIFSKSARKGKDISQDASNLFEFVSGDIISVSSTKDAGVGATEKKDEGKRIKEIQSSFCIETTENKYHIAIKECVTDEFDKNNEGVVSIYIIEDSVWGQDYVYRGNAEWSKGINIIDKVV